MTTMTSTGPRLRPLLLAIALLLLVSACGTLGYSNTECTRYGYMAVSRQYCLVSTSSGGCSRWSTSHTLQPVC